MFARKLLSLSLVIFLLVISGEIIYYFYLSPNNIKNNKNNTVTNTKSIITNSPVNSVTVTPTTPATRQFAGKLDMVEVAKSRILTEEEIDQIINNPAYQGYFPTTYDKQSKKIYLDTDPNQYAYGLKTSGVNMAALMNNAILSKDTLGYAYTAYQLKGTMAHIDINQIQGGELVPLYIFLVGKDNIVVTYSFYENFINKAKFVKLENGVEKTMNWKTELKDGDQVMIEEKNDLTKHPQDQDYVLEAKFTKL